MSTPTGCDRICSAAWPRVRIDLPPLSDRQEDVPAIAARVLEEVAAERGTEAARVHAGGAGAGRRGHVAGQPGRAAGGHHAGRRRAGRSRHPGGARAAGAASAAGAGPIRADRQPARGASAVRARLHFGGPAASRLADGRRRADAWHSTSKSLQKSAPARHPRHPDVRVAWRKMEKNRDHLLLARPGRGAIAVVRSCLRPDACAANQPAPACAVPAGFVIAKPEGRVRRSARRRHVRPSTRTATGSGCTTR